MKPKTLILMVVAVGCGLGASYMTSKLLADRSTKPLEVQTVPVVVAKVRVPGWQQIKYPEKQFEIKQYPADVAPKRAISNLADLKDQRLNKPLDESKPVTLDDLLTKEQQTIADQLQPGQRAVAVKVNAESLAGGFVLPGTRVDVICTTRGSEPSSKVVLQNMLVLAVDMQSDRNPEQRAMIGQTVTIAATPIEATKLTLASEIGSLRLSVKNHGDNNIVNVPIVKAADLNKPSHQSNGEESEKPEALTTPAPTATTTPLPVLPADDTTAAVEEPPVVVAPRPKRKHVMTIQNGTKREQAVFTHEEEDEITSSDPVGTANPETPSSTQRPEVTSPPTKPKTGPVQTAAKSGVGGSKTTRTKRIQ